MLDIRVNMHGSLRRFLPNGISSVCLRVTEGMTLREVAAHFDVEGEVWLSAIGKQIVPLSMPLTQDVTVDFFPLLEGG